MEFLKRNWAALTLAIVSAVGLLLAILALALNGDILGDLDFGAYSAVIGIMLFFLGMCAYFVCKMLGVCGRVRAIILIVTGVLAAVFTFITVIEIATVYSDVPSALRPSGVRSFLMLQWILVLALTFVMGVFPIVKGIKKLCGSCKKKDKSAD